MSEVPPPGALTAAAAALAGGEVLAVPTDTVHGLVCDPANPDAVERIYRLKDRPAELELTLLAADAGQLDGLVRWTGDARRLAAALWPGALSLVLPVGDRHLAVPRRGTTLSVRVPAHPPLLALLRRTGPVASTSANRHGEPAATTATAVREQFGDRVTLLGDGGSPGGRASTIIDCSVTPPRVLREGPVDRRRLCELLQG